MPDTLVLVLGTADWDAPIATNQHRVVRELARQFDVLFADGTATRRLRLSGEDLRRLGDRLVPQPRSGGRTVPPCVTRVGPVLVPYHGAATRTLNARLLHAQLRRWTEHRGPRALWSYTPFTYGLEALADHTVYHLVDLLHHNPGVPAGRLLRAERALAERTALALATSEPIGRHLGQQGFRSVRVLPNVADVGTFLAATAPRTRPPVVLFTGALAPHKLDLPLLELLAGRLAGKGSLRLVGPSPSGANDPRLARLRAAGAQLLPLLRPEALALEVARASVGIVPYQLTELTRGISPLKTYEYLAGGLPVVSTALPAVQPVPGAIWTERSREAFVARVLALLDDDPDEGATARRGLAATHDWPARGAVLRRLLEEGLTRSCRPLPA